MSFIAIGKITTLSNALKSLRLFETESCSYRDIEVSVVKQAIQAGKIKVDNLGVSGNKLLGTNGSINRLPEVFEYKDLKSAVTIINQIEDIGYTIVDYKGRVLNVKTEQLVTYGETYGISNGKIVERANGKKFISSISGEYRVVTLDNIKNQSIKYNKHTGELISKPLFNAVMCSSVSTNGLHIVYKYHIENNELKRSRIRKQISAEDLNDKSIVIKGDYLYDIIDKQDVDRARNVLCYSEANFAIRNEIVGLKYKVHSRNDYVIDQSTGIIKPDNVYRYNDLHIKYNELISSSKNTNIADDIAKFKVMNNRIRIYKSTLDNQCVPLYRIVTPNGIDYMVLCKSGGMLTKQISLESMIAEIGIYVNCEIDNGNIIVSALDGVFKYNIDLIYKSYGRKVKASTNKLKAKVLGIKIEESIHENGDIREISSTSEHLIIPEGALRLLKGSVKISDKCKEITIPESLLEIDDDAIPNRILRLNKLNLNCAVNLRKKIYKYFRYSDRTEVIKIDLKEPVSKQELKLLVFDIGFNLSNITINKSSNYEKEQIIDYIESSTLKRLNGEEILSRDIQIDRHEYNKSISYYVVREDDYKIHTMKSKLERLAVIATWSANSNNYLKQIKLLQAKIKEKEDEVKRNIKILTISDR